MVNVGKYTSPMDLMGIGFHGIDVNSPKAATVTIRICKHFSLKSGQTLPIPSMYGIFPYIWLIFMANVGKYTIHGLFGLYIQTPF